MSLIRSIFSFVKRHRWKSIGAAVALLLVVGFAYSASQPKQAEYVTAVAQKGDLKQTVEAVGTVVSERDLQLQFPQSGIVAQVLVKEGQKVNAGTRLAALRSGNVAADIAAASARLQSAEAELRELTEGTRPEDIAIAEAELQNKKAALETSKSTLANAEKSLDQSKLKLDALEREADINVAGSVSTIGSTLTIQLTTAQNALSTIEDIFGNNDVQDAMLKSSPSDYESLVRAKNNAEAAVSAQLSMASPTDFESALLAVDRVRAVVTTVWTVVGNSFDTINALQVSGSFEQSAKEGYKTQLSSEKSSVQSALGAIDSAAKALRDAVAGVDTQIAAEKSAIVSAEGTRDRAKIDIGSYETAVRISEAQLSLKKAGARKTDIDAASARVRQELASLQRARADYSNTVLVAPIAGTVTKLNVKTGEFTPAGPAVTLLGTSAFRIEMFVSEIDVPKVQTTQTGSIELDAFRGTNFKLRVSQIDTAPTDRDGVSKYRLKLDFQYPHDELKIGMTGDAEIVTGFKGNVVSVPQRAVIESGSGMIVRVKKEDGSLEERPVTTGMEGEGGNIEVTGIQEGETIVVLVKE